MLVLEGQTKVDKHAWHCCSSWLGLEMKVRCEILAVRQGEHLLEVTAEIVG